jgi:hypothetical protein
MRGWRGNVCVFWVLLLYKERDPASPPPPPPCIWDNKWRRYWSAKIDDISLWPPGMGLTSTDYNPSSAGTSFPRHLAIIGGLSDCQHRNSISNKRNRTQRMCHIRTVMILFHIGYTIKVWKLLKCNAVCHVLNYIGWFWSITVQKPASFVADMFPVHSADDLKWEVYCGKEELRIREGL